MPRNHGQTFNRRSRHDETRLSLLFPINNKNISQLRFPTTFSQFLAKMATSVDAKLLKATKFPIEFNQKVDMQKVNADLMKKYVGYAYNPGYLVLIGVADGLQAEYRRF